MPTVDPTGAAATSVMDAAARPASGATGAFDGMGSDAFMKLLVAQMRYQNPLAPKDGTEYLAQISQYAMVEQLQKLSKGQEEVTAYHRALIATSLIGKVVSGVGEAGTAVTGTVERVEYRMGKPVLVTSGGDIAVDRLQSAAGSPTSPAQPSPTSPAQPSPTSPAADPPPAAGPVTGPAANPNDPNQGDSTP